MIAAGVLAHELESLLTGDPWILTSVELFGDLVWDANMTAAEAIVLDPAVLIDHPDSWRRIVFQRVRGELRYWLTTDRRPDESGNDARTELGTVDSVDRAAKLCREHLMGGVRPSALKTPRSAGERVDP